MAARRPLPFAEALQYISLFLSCTKVYRKSPEQLLLKAGVWVWGLCNAGCQLTKDGLDEMQDLIQFSQKLPMTFDICHIMDVDPKTYTVTHGPLVNSTCDMGKLSDRDIQGFLKSIYVTCDSPWTPAINRSFGSRMQPVSICVTSYNKRPKEPSCHVYSRSFKKNYHTNLLKKKIIPIRFP